MAQERRWAKTGRGLAGLPLGSWRSTLIAAAVLIALFAAVIAVATTSGPLRHTSFPGHPYPPSDFVQNPFSSNPDDLLNVADVARVKAEFEKDGRIELEAFANGDAGVLSQADAGGRLQTLQQLIVQNNVVGIVQRYENHTQSIVVGRRAAPASSSITWYVEEKGTASLSDVDKLSGHVSRMQGYRFNGKFWLAQAGDHYLITDAAISNEPSEGG